MGEGMLAPARCVIAHSTWARVTIAAMTALSSIAAAIAFDQGGRLLFALRSPGMRATLYVLTQYHTLALGMRAFGRA